mmetsp:Transcript_22113/g.35611  ORF Transcript_22113/g.35611 Transcript_22113/m.35611 type:complete len:183 (-) Transcript_22113:1027-1575(-)
MIRFLRKRGLARDSVASITADSETKDRSGAISSSVPETVELSQQEVRQLKKNRKFINKCVQKIGKQAHLDLSLDSYGFCYVPFKRFLIIISVGPENVHLETMIYDLTGSHGETRTRKRIAAMQLRGVCLGEKKSRIRLEGDEVYLSNSCPIRGLRFSGMCDLLDDFMATASNTNADLAALSR